MRLTKEQVNTIVKICHTIAGENSTVWLYGSRLDDNRHGGDIDVLIESPLPVTLMQRARIKLFLEQQLNLPVDVLVNNPQREENAFISMIRPKAKQLETIS